MGRASYQNIDNIVIGNKGDVPISLVKKNHKPVKVCVGTTFTATSFDRPKKPILRIKKN